jgi:hypothetical protein
MQYLLVCFNPRSNLVSIFHLVLHSLLSPVQILPEGRTKILSKTSQSMSPTTSESVLKAVIFDVCIDLQISHRIHLTHRFHIILLQIGGVVLSSPFIAIAQYEQEIGIPTDYLNVSMLVSSTYIHFILAGNADSGPGIPLLVQKEVLVVPGRGSNAENSPCLIFIEILGMTCRTLSTVMYGTRNTV